MKKVISFTDDAKGDINDAYNYYEEIRSNLGEEFLDEVDETVANITTNAKMYAKIYGHVRRAVLNRFPYAVLYVIRDVEVTIFAVFNTYKNPKKWEKRANEQNGEELL